MYVEPFKNVRVKVESGDEVLTLKQAAERLGRSATTLRLQVHAGKLHATLVGKMYLVTSMEVERYRREVLGKYGFASPLHPKHGTQAGGGRRKGEHRP
jgi:excisionase family DNA binding protein